MRITQWLTTCVLLLGCAQLDNEGFPRTTQWIKPFSSRRIVYSQYTGRRISYFINSICTLQVPLIRSGDVHPNPGPGRHEACASDDNNLTMYQHQLQGPGQQQSVIKYDKAALINPKYHSRIEYTVWATIRSLGITAKRGKRGGQKNRNRKRKHNPNEIPVTFSKKNWTHWFCLWQSSRYIVGICETWLFPDDSAINADMTPDGYIFKHVPRSNRRGGGIGLLHRSGLQVNICKTPQKFISFESMQAEIIDNAVSFHLVIIYRPPGSKHPFSGFIDEFARLADSFLI